MYMIDTTIWCRYNATEQRCIVYNKRVKILQQNGVYDRKNSVYDDVYTIQQNGVYVATNRCMM